MRRVKESIKGTWVGQLPRDVREEKEAPPGFEPGVDDLQSSALPLGEGAVVFRDCSAIIGRLLLETRDFA